MSKIRTTENGRIKLSLWNIVVLSVIVGFFSIVAHCWEHRRRVEFKRHVHYRQYPTEQLKQVLADFEYMIACKDPYIEHFNQKHPDFAPLHHLWVLNSHEYWTEKFRAEIERRERL